MITPFKKYCTVNPVRQTDIAKSTSPNFDATKCPVKQRPIYFPDTLSRLELLGHDINPLSLRRGYININENLLQHQSCFNQQVIELSDFVISRRQQTTLHYKNLQYKTYA